MTGIPFRPGVCSVTFRKLAPKQLVDLCVRTGIEAIEWGMDTQDRGSHAEFGQLVRCGKPSRSGTDNNCFRHETPLRAVRGSVARKLVSLRFDENRLPANGADVFRGDDRTGRITSVCRSPAHGAPLALAFVRAPQATVGARLVVEHDDERLGCSVIGPPAIA